jgi:hypothetical protein
MKCHGIHPCDNVVVRLGENGSGSVVVVNNLDSGLCWLLATTATEAEAEFIDIEVNANEVRN